MSNARRFLTVEKNYDNIATTTRFVSFKARDFRAGCLWTGPSEHEAHPGWAEGRVAESVLRTKRGIG
jgi:hypothetical protein